MRAAAAGASAMPRPPRFREREKRASRSGQRPRGRTSPEHSAARAGAPGVCEGGFVVSASRFPSALRVPAPPWAPWRRPVDPDAAVRPHRSHRTCQLLRWTGPAADTVPSAAREVGRPGPPLSAEKMGLCFLKTSSLWSVCQTPSVSFQGRRLVAGGPRGPALAPPGPRGEAGTFSDSQATWYDND